MTHLRLTRHADDRDASEDPPGAAKVAPWHWPLEHGNRLNCSRDSPVTENERVGGRDEGDMRLA
jgi:hypothetical protein